MNKEMLLKQYLSYHKKSSARLPSAYQEVEYIENSLTQYINTLVIPTSKTSCEVEFEQPNRESVWLFGADTSWGNNGFGFNTHVPNKETTLYPLLYINSSTYIDFEQIEENQRYVFKYGNGVFSINGTEYSVPSFTGTLTNPLYTNCINRNGTPDSLSKGGILKLYSLKFYEDNTIIRDFIPCYRKSDNEVGLYDIVNNQFYKNQGTGSFLCGRDIVNIDGYRQLDYIGGSGAYIVFPYETNGQNVGFDIEFDVPSLSLTSDAGIIKNDYSNAYVPVGMTLTRVNKTYFGSYTIKSLTYWTNATYTYNENRYQINYLNSNKIKSIDKSNWEYSLSKDLTNVAISNFTIMSENVPSSFHLFYLTISDGENNIAKLIPMEETDSGLVGLYDIIGKRFYSSETSTNFTKGNYI